MAVSVRHVHPLESAEVGVLAGGGGILGAAWTLPGLWARGIHPMPPCVFHQLTGLPCPFCGGTRSFVAIAHGNLAAAVHVYPIGPLLFLALLAAMALAAVTLVTGRRLRLDLDPVTRNRLLAAGIAVLALNWGAKLFFLGY